MASAMQYLSLPFSGGLSEKISKKILPLPFLTRVSNLRYKREGSLTSRLPLGRLESLDPLPDTTLNLFNFDGQLVSLGRESVHSYDIEQKKWNKITDRGSLSFELFPITQKEDDLKVPAFIFNNQDAYCFYWNKGTVLYKRFNPTNRRVMEGERFLFNEAEEPLAMTGALYAEKMYLIVCTASKIKSLTLRVNPNQQLSVTSRDDLNNDGNVRRARVRGRKFFYIDSDGNFQSQPIVSKDPLIDDPTDLTASDILDPAADSFTFGLPRGRELWGFRDWCRFTYNSQQFKVIWSISQGYFILNSQNQIVGHSHASFVPFKSDDSYRMHYTGEAFEKDDKIYLPVLKTGQIEQVEGTTDVIFPLGMELLEIDILSSPAQMAKIGSQSLISGAVNSYFNGQQFVEYGFTEKPVIEKTPTEDYDRWPYGDALERDLPSVGELSRTDYVEFLTNMSKKDSPYMIQEVEITARTVSSQIGALADSDFTAGTAGDRLLRYGTSFPDQTASSTFGTLAKIYYDTSDGAIIAEFTGAGSGVPPKALLIAGVLHQFEYGALSSGTYKAYSFTGTNPFTAGSTYKIKVVGVEELANTSELDTTIQEATSDNNQTEIKIKELGLRKFTDKAHIFTASTVRNISSHAVTFEKLQVDAPQITVGSVSLLPYATAPLFLSQDRAFNNNNQVDRNNFSTVLKTWTLPDSGSDYYNYNAFNITGNEIFYQARHRTNSLNYKFITYNLDNESFSNPITSVRPFTRDLNGFLYIKRGSNIYYFLTIGDDDGGTTIRSNFPSFNNIVYSNPAHSGQIFVLGNNIFYISSGLSQVQAWSLEGVRESSKDFTFPLISGADIRGSLNFRIQFIDNYFNSSVQASVNFDYNFPINVDEGIGAEGFVKSGYETELNLPASYTPAGSVDSASVATNIELSGVWTDSMNNEVGNNFYIAFSTSSANYSTPQAFRTYIQSQISALRIGSYNINLAGLADSAVTGRVNSGVTSVIYNIIGAVSASNEVRTALGNALQGSAFNFSTRAGEEGGYSSVDTEIQPVIFHAIYEGSKELQPTAIRDVLIYRDTDQNLQSQFTLPSNTIKTIKGADSGKFYYWKETAENPLDYNPQIFSFLNPPASLQWRQVLVETEVGLAQLLRAFVYRYRCRYKWLDDTGIEHRSGWSNEVSLFSNSEIGEEGNQPTFFVNNLHLTNKNQDALSIEIYRTGNRLNEFKLLKEVSNDINIESQRVTDDVIDRNLGLGSGGDNVLVSGAKFCEEYLGRYVLYGFPEKTNRFIVSSPIRGLTNEAIDFRQSGLAGDFIEILTPSAIRSIRSMDQYLIIFCEDGVHSWTVNEVSVAQQYPKPVTGLAKIVARDGISAFRVDDGLIFLSNKGIWLVSRGLGSDFVGRDVQDFEGNILGIEELGDRDEIVFLTDSSTHPVLVYNYRFKKWSTFSDTGLVSITDWKDSYAVADKNGRIMVPREQPNKTQIFEIETGWVNMQKIQGYQRLKELTLLGTFMGLTSLSFEYSYDFFDDLSERVNVSLAALRTEAARQMKPVDGLSQFRIQQRTQKCNAFKVKIIAEAKKAELDGIRIGFKVLTGTYLKAV